MPLVEKHYRAKLAAGQREKVLAALARRGFSYGEAKDAVNEVLAEAGSGRLRFLSGKGAQRRIMKIALISLGCPKNQVDADVMCPCPAGGGAHHRGRRVQEADCVLINTCGFIESAKQEAIDTILEACSHKAQNPALKVVVTGCLAERYREEIRKEMPEVDAVVGIGSNAAIVVHPRAAGAGRGRHRELRPQGCAAAFRQARYLHTAPLCLSENSRGLFKLLYLLRHSAHPRAAAQPHGGKLSWQRRAGLRARV